MAVEMDGWMAFERSAPKVAAAGRRLLAGDGMAVAYLATVRKDGGPRVHPVMPVLAAGELYLFVINLGWKYGDLGRDSRYALHSAAAAEGGEEFYVTGLAVESADPAERARVREACGGRLGSHDFEALFRLGIDRALHTSWANWGTAETWPEYHKWAAS